MKAKTKRLIEKEIWRSFDAVIYAAVPTVAVWIAGAPDWGIVATLTLAYSSAYWGRKI